MAAMANVLWKKGGGGKFSLGPDQHAAHLVEKDLCKIWTMAAEPLLFSVIGAALDFKQIEPGTIPKAIAVILGALVIRIVVAYISTCGAGLTSKERLFIALAWMPKATVQAALGPVPLDMMRNAFDRSEDPEKWDRNQQLGVDILTTAVFAILITAPIGLLVIQYLGPVWLEQDAPTPPIDDNTPPELAHHGAPLHHGVPGAPTIDRVQDVVPEDLISQNSHPDDYATADAYVDVLPTLPPSSKGVKDRFDLFVADANLNDDGIEDLTDPSPRCEDLTTPSPNIPGSMGCPNWSLDQKTTPSSRGHVASLR